MSNNNTRTENKKSNGVLQNPSLVNFFLDRPKSSKFYILWCIIQYLRASLMSILCLDTFKLLTENIVIVDDSLRSTIATKLYFDKYADKKYRISMPLSRYVNVDLLVSKFKTKPIIFNSNTITVVYIIKYVPIIVKFRNLDEVEILYFRFTFNKEHLFDFILHEVDQIKIDGTKRFKVIEYFGNLSTNTPTNTARQDDDTDSGPARNEQRTHDPINFALTFKDDEELYYCNIFGGPMYSLDMNIEAGPNPFLGLFYDQSILDIKTEIEEWLLDKTWYQDKNLTWKRGYLLTGSPGTGKTAFIRAIAEEINVPIVQFNLGTMTDNDFSRYWGLLGRHKPCIVLFEDLDSIFNKRKNLISKTGITFTHFLNILDGVTQSNGILLFITTNCPETIDTALERPGRIDRRVEFTYLNNLFKEQCALEILSEFPKSSWEDLLTDQAETGSQFKEKCCQRALELFREKKDVKKKI